MYNPKNTAGEGASFLTLSSISTLQACCWSCAQATGCIVWYLDGTPQCILTFGVTSSGLDTSAHCPLGLQSLLVNVNTVQPIYAVGPCGIVTGPE